MNAPIGNKWLANLFQGGLLLFLLLLASYVTIGRILITNVNSYRADITRVIATSVGVPVHIGELSGGWAYLDPSVDIQEFSLGELESVKLENLSITVDVVASLLERSLVIREASISGLRLIVEKQGDKWQVMGMPASDQPFDPEPLLRSVDYLVELSLSDIEIEMLGRHSSFVVRTHPGQSGEVRRVGETLSLAVPMQIQDADGSHDFLFAGQYQGQFGEKESEGSLYLNLPQLLVTEFVPEAQLTAAKISGVNIGGEIWAHLQADEIELQAETHLALSFSEGEHDLWSDQKFSLKGQIGGELVGSIAEIKGDFAGVDWRFSDIGVSFEPGPDGDQIAVQIPKLDLADLLRTPIELGRRGIGLNADQLTTLEALNPTGQLNSVMAIVTLGDLDYRVVAQLEAVGVERYMALPMISDLNGLVQIGPTGGFLDMINEQPFSLQFPNMFEEEWYFDDARTRFSYDVTDQGIQVKTGLVQAHWGELIANGRVHLRLPGDPLLTTWGLELGVQRAELLDAFRYLPNTVKPDVREWLERSILGGRSNESGMIFHGSLAKQAAKDQKVHQLYFEVTHSILDYDPAWPRFDDLAATIFIDNFEISSGDAVGRVFDSEVYDSTVKVPVSAEGVADAILIEGKLRGQFSDGVRILNETPLAETTQNMALGWLAEGEMQGTAKLDIPLGPRAEKGVPVWSDVTVNLAGASLNMSRFDLSFENLKGDFRYETHTAMNSEVFTADLFDQPVTGKIESAGDALSGEIVAYLDGQIAADDLYKWSKQPLLSKAAGTVSYNADLHIFYGQGDEQPIYVNAISSLEGVSLNLPEPMGKLPEEAVELSYRQTFFDQGYGVDVTLGTEVKARLQVFDDTITGGLIHFGETPVPEFGYDQLKVSGTMEHVVYEEWDALSTDLQAVSEGSLEEELERTLDHVMLQIELFDVFGFEMDQVQSKIVRAPNYWHVDLSNSWLEGRVSVADDDEAPLEIAMKRLAFESSDGESGVDPLVDISPEDLTLALFSVEQLTLDGEDYGSWGFLYEPGQNSALLSNMMVDVRGLKVAEDASVIWAYEQGEHMSAFDGTVLVPDLGYALQQWGYASSIEGQDFSFYGDVSWSGSPAMVDLDVIDGLIRVIDGEGRFVQADNNMGALRLLGIFDFASLARRFRFDFSDVVKSGFSFSSIEGEARFDSGVIDVVDPILIEGSGSTFKVAGRVDLTSRVLDNDMIVTLPVNRNLPWYAAYSAFATGPLTGAGVFIAQRVFQNQINAISSAKYKITGTMDEPNIEFVSIFSDSVREAPEVEQGPGQQPTGR